MLTIQCSNSIIHFLYSFIWNEAVNNGFGIKYTIYHRTSSLWYTIIQSHNYNTHLSQKLSGRGCTASSGMYSFILNEAVNNGLEQKHTMYHWTSSLWYKITQTHNSKFITFITKVGR